MLSRKTGPRVGLALAALALVAWSVAPARAADDDAALRKRVLALNEITGDDPMRGEILTLIDDPAGTKKLLPVAAKLAKEKPSPLNYNAAFILARAAQQLKEYDGSAALYRVCAAQARQLLSPDKLYQSYRGIITDYYAAGKYDDGLKACQEFLEIPEEMGADKDDPETQKYNAMLRRAKGLIRQDLVQILMKQGKADEANKIVERMLKTDPEDIDALELRAGVQQEAGKYDEAVKTYEEIVKLVQDAIDRVNKNPALPKDEKAALVKSFNGEVRHYRYLESGLYIDAKQVDKAADVLKGLLKEEPDNPGYNNDLGYIWADNGQNLAEAEKLIRKAIADDKKQRQEAKPDTKPDEIKANPAYLDSLGWVLFKQKKYKEALPPLQEAVKEEEGQHVEIFDHLAEVHMALGDKAAALDAWKKGVESAGTTKREQERKAEVEKKIKAMK